MGTHCKFWSLWSKGVQWDWEICYFPYFPCIYLDCDHPIMDAVCSGFSYASVVMVFTSFMLHFILTYLFTLVHFICYHLIWGGVEQVFEFTKWLPLVSCEMEEMDVSYPVSILCYAWACVIWLQKLRPCLLCWISGQEMIEYILMCGLLLDKNCFISSLDCTAFHYKLIILIAKTFKI